MDSSRLRRRASAIMASHSAVVIANGFSQTTPLPAFRHWSASLACVLCGVMMATRSTSDFFSMAGTDVYVSMPGKSFAAASRREASISATATGVMPACFISFRWARPC